MKLHRIFVGFDPRQCVSYSVLQTSLYGRATKPISITPLCLPTLPMERAGLTPFTYSRFLVPWLCDFEGWALFLDADILLLDDVCKLWDYADDRFSVMVVHHEGYEFELASMMLFNCAHPDNRILTPEYVDDPELCKAPHLMDWTQNAGKLPREWNFLVGYQEAQGDEKLVHFTQGIPAFPETNGCDYTPEWFKAHSVMNSTEPWINLMGNSVHAKKLDDGRVVPKLMKVA